ncbi:MAG: hypothetical protein NVSMB1_23360 [Polyangiales bacterium]
MKLPRHAVRAAPLFLLLLAPACAASQSSATPNSGDSPFTAKDAGATGVYEGKDAACKSFVAALTDKAQALKCTLIDEDGKTSVPSCPDTLDAFERRNFGHRCVDGYDAGTVDNCVKRIAAYQVCADFADAQKHCVMRVRLAPMCNDASDAGDAGDARDAGAETSASDASSKESDAPGETTPEATPGT